MPKKSSYRKRRPMKKRRSYKKAKKRTFKAKSKGMALLRNPAMAFYRLPGKLVMPVFVKNNSGASIPDNNYCIGAVALINNPQGVANNSPVTFGQTFSIYRCLNVYILFGVFATRYDEFRIVGVRTKFIFPTGGLFGGNNLMSLEMFYDGNSTAWGFNVATSHIEAYSNYLMIPITVNNTTVSRYWDCRPILKKLGIGWCSTSDLPNNAGNGGFTYYNLLANTVVPSIGYRITAIGALPLNTLVGTCEVTYYIQFRGLNYGTGGTGYEDPTQVKTVTTTNLVDITYDEERNV